MKIIFTIKLLIQVFYPNWYLCECKKQVSDNKLLLIVINGRDDEEKNSCKLITILHIPSMNIDALSCSLRSNLINPSPSVDAF